MRGGGRALVEAGNSVVGSALSFPLYRYQGSSIGRQACECFARGVISLAPNNILREPKTAKTGTPTGSQHFPSLLASGGQDATVGGRRGVSLLTGLLTPLRE